MWSNLVWLSWLFIWSKPPCNQKRGLETFRNLLPFFSHTPALQAMSSTVPLLTDNQILGIGLATVGSTVLLTSFAILSTPDIPLLLLLTLCFAANYAWIQHIDSGWGSQNALDMFRCSLVVGIVGLFGGLYRCERKEWMESRSNELRKRAHGECHNYTYQYLTL